MLSAGWGGTGSVQYSMKQASGFDDMDDVLMDISRAPRQSTRMPASASYDSLATPSVWRASRTVASRALNSRASLDSFEIPAFLRKEAGAVASDHPNNGTSASGEAGLSPKDLSQWLSTNAQSAWPLTYDALRDLGLGLAICEWLELRIGAGHGEHDVVQAFLAVLMEFRFARSKGVRQTIKLIRDTVQLGRNLRFPPELAYEIRAGLLGVQATNWPDAIASSPSDLPPEFHIESLP
jgi:hypothetical protein